jgi:hypothetical protein
MERKLNIKKKYLRVIDEKGPEDQRKQAFWIPCKLAS